jgi:hypothetical protein
VSREAGQPGELPPQPPPIAPAAPEIDRTTLQLLARWKAEDATNDPAEVRAAEIELAEFKEAMNQSRIRAGEPPLYP